MSIFRHTAIFLCLPVLILPLAAAWPSSPSKKGSAEVCIVDTILSAETEQQSKLLNANVGIKLQRYRMEAARGIPRLNELFGKEFETRIFRQHARWLDSGAGMAAGPLQLEQFSSTGEVVAVNKQNFWQEIHDLEASLRAEPERDPSQFQWERVPGQETLYKKIGNVVIWQPSGGGHYKYISPFTIRGIPYSILLSFARKVRAREWVLDQDKFEYGLDGEKKAYAEAKKLLFDVSDYLRRRSKSKGLQYVASYAEDYLDEPGPQFDVISDLFGSFYYSATRLSLIEKYYRRLAPGGKAFIGLNPKHILDSVRLDDGRSVPFFQFLTSRFGNVIRVIPQKDSDFVSLVITRDPSVETLDLGLEREPGSTFSYLRFKDTEGYDVPIVHYVLKSVTSPE